MKIECDADGLNKTIDCVYGDCGDWQTLRAAAFCILCNLWKFKLVSDIQRVAVIQPRVNDCTRDTVQLQHHEAKSSGVVARPGDESCKP